MQALKIYAAFKRYAGRPARLGTLENDGSCMVVEKANVNTEDLVEKLKRMYICLRLGDDAYLYGAEFAVYNIQGLSPWASGRCGTSTPLIITSTTPLTKCRFPKVPLRRSRQGMTDSLSAKLKARDARRKTPYLYNQCQSSDKHGS